jgi:hypothetical protein
MTAMGRAGDAFLTLPAPDMRLGGEYENAEKGSTSRCTGRGSSSAAEWLAAACSARGAVRC